MTPGAGSVDSARVAPTWFAGFAVYAILGGLSSSAWGCGRIGYTLQPGDEAPPQADFGELEPYAITLVPQVRLTGAYWGEEYELAEFKAYLNDREQTCDWGQGLWDCGSAPLDAEGIQLVRLQLTDRSGNVGEPSIKIFHNVERDVDGSAQEVLGAIRVLRSFMSARPLHAEGALYSKSVPWLEVWAMRGSGSAVGLATGSH